MKRFIILLPLLVALSNAVAQVGEPCSNHLSGSDKVNYEKALVAYESKHYTEAAALLRKVSARNSKAVDPYFYLGLTAVAKSDNPGAIRRYFTKLIDLCPDYPDPRAHYYRAVVYYTDEEYESAIAELNRYFDLVNEQSSPEQLALYEEASNYLYWSQFLAEAYRNQVPFVPQLITGVSSRYNEYLPYITFDGQQIYFIRELPENATPTFYDKVQEHYVPRLCVGQWRDTAFTAVQSLPPPFNLNEGEGSLCLTADGKHMYYSFLQKENGYLNCDIYTSNLLGGQWQPVRSAGRNVNTSTTWESQPTITPDGQYLYFASNRPGGQGGTDIWRCRRLPNGDWGRAENLGPSVNTAGNEKSPFICADGHTLYFASNGWQGFGGYDMYFIDMSNTSMQRPTNLGLPINGEKDDICFGVMSDGRRAYYSGKNSSIFAGMNDIYLFDLYPEARPESMRPCKGQLCSGNHPVAGEIQLLRYGAEPSVYPISDEGYFTIMISNSEDNLLVAQAENCFPLLLSVPRNARQLPDTLNLRPLSLNQCYSIIIIPQALDIYADYLLAHPYIHVCVRGSDAVTKQIYNHFLGRGLRSDRLSQQRGATPSLVVTRVAPHQ